MNEEGIVTEFVFERLIRNWNFFFVILRFSRILGKLMIMNTSNRVGNLVWTLVD